MLSMASALIAGMTLLSPLSGEAIDAAPSHAGVATQSVRIWLAGDDFLRYGEGAEVYFRTDDDAYVAVIRIDTDGYLHLLYPESSYRLGRVRGGRTYTASQGGFGSFTANEPSGLGFVFAIASDDPFDFDNLGLGASARFASLGRVTGDPFFAIENLAIRLLDNPNAAIVLDFVEYHVGQRTVLPRYASYDCYASSVSIGWNPFGYRCRGYHDAGYSDSYYYRDRYYGGRRVVYVREPRRPRYDFKTEPQRSSGSTGISIGYREREDNRDYRRPGSPTSDPNLPVRRAESNPGATRPGDDVSGGTVGRRRVVVTGEETRERSGPNRRPPRQEVFEERTPGTPRRDGGEAQRRREPEPARDQDRARRVEPAIERQRPAENRARDRSTETKPDNKSTGESRRRRTPSGE